MIDKQKGILTEIERIVKAYKGNATFLNVSVQDIPQSENPPWVLSYCKTSTFENDIDVLRFNVVLLVCEPKPMPHVCNTEFEYEKLIEGIHQRFSNLLRKIIWLLTCWDRGEMYTLIGRVALTNIVEKDKRVRVPEEWRSKVDMVCTAAEFTLECKQYFNEDVCDFDLESLEC